MRKNVTGEKESEVPRMNAAVDVSNVKLETERLMIRPWQDSDAEDLYAYASVDGVGQMAGWKPHKSLEESKEILKMFQAGKNQFALEAKETHQVIGSLGLEKYNPKLEKENTYYKNKKGREVGYVISKKYWGQGLAAEAVKRIISYCFEEQKYDFFSCEHFVWNAQSKRVIEKCGFQFLMDIRGKVEDSRMYILERK